MKLTEIHQLTQAIIDAIGNKQPIVARHLIEDAQQLLHHLMDYCKNDEELIVLSKYETLITLLQNK